MPETTLYIIRHGQTELNFKKLAQGWSDSKLTKDGIEACKNAGKILSDTLFEAVYVSDLKRTSESAEIIMAENKNPKTPIIAQENLKEINFGSFEQQPHAVLRNAFMKKINIKALYRMFFKKEHVKIFIDAISSSDKTRIAENYTDFSKRIYSAIGEICDKTSQSGGGNILIVSHGTAIAALLFEAGYRLKEPIENAVIYKLLYNGSGFERGQISKLTYSNSYMERHN